MVEVRYVDIGLANNFGDYIEINEHLKGYPELHDAILDHELQHTDKVFSKEDFLLDLAPSKVDYWKLFKFMVIYPKTFLQFAPFYYQKDKGLVYDINLIISWIVVIGLLVATFMFLT
jgi:hypothetical protein